MIKPDVTAFFHEATFTVTYVVADSDTGKAAIVDSILDFDAASGRTATHSADAVITFVRSNQLNIEWILETHIHADHLSGASYLRTELGGQVAAGKNVGAVQETFKAIFNISELDTDGSQFDHLFGDQDEFQLGSTNAYVIATPGHTPCSVSYVFGDAAFVGDTLFMPDFGTARTDFPAGSAAHLYDSIQAIFALPDETRLFMCHDYKPPGREKFVWETSVREQRDTNIHIKDGVSKGYFVAMREKRDKELGVPKLLMPSIQVNIRAGELPAAEDNEIRYLKIPLNTIQS